jgi:hypothetical protein
MTANGTKEFADRVEVPSVFRAGLSLRAADSAELLVCDGWNPYNYPCYHLNMSRTEIFLRKYTTLRKNISSSDRFLDSYKVKHVYFYFFKTTLAPGVCKHLVRRRVAQLRRQPRRQRRPQLGRRQR